MIRFLCIFLCVVCFISCDDEVVVKPSALLSLEYPSGDYDRIESDCPYSFMKNGNARISETRNCGLNVNYSKMHATIYMTYQEVNNNLDSLLYDAQKLAYDHNRKAQGIPEQPFVNTDNNAYGMFYMINGNAASQSHFYVTDSIRHFVTGSLYFEAKPNFDSIYPAVVYLRDDIRSIMETMRWEDK